MTMVNEFPCQAANKGLTAAFGAERIYLPSVINFLHH